MSLWKVPVQPSCQVLDGLPGPFSLPGWCYFFLLSGKSFSALRAGGFPYHRTVRRVTDLGILKVWLCLKWFEWFWFWIGLNTPAKSVLYLLPMGFVFITKGDRRCWDNTNGKRLVPSPCEWSSINQVAQGWLNSVSGVDKKWGCWWYVGEYSTLLWRKNKRRKTCSTWPLWSWSKGKSHSLRKPIKIYSPLLPYCELELFLKVTAWARSGPSRSTMDVEKVSPEQLLQNIYTYFS